MVDAEDRRLARLERLGRLKEQGALTSEEFEREKARLFGDGEALNDGDPDFPDGAAVGYRRYIPWGVAGVAILIAAAAIFGSSIFEDASDPALAGESEQAGNAALTKVTVPRSQPIVNMAFERPTECIPEETLSEALATLRSLDPSVSGQEVNLGRLGSWPGRVETVNSGGENEVVIADVELRSRLHSLNVVAIRSSMFGEAVATTQIRFRENADKARAVLNKADFNLPPVGELRTGNIDEESAVVMGIEELPSGSALTCAHTT